MLQSTTTTTTIHTVCFDSHLPVEHSQNPRVKWWKRAQRAVVQFCRRSRRRKVNRNLPAVKVSLTVKSRSRVEFKFIVIVGGMG